MRTENVCVCACSYVYTNKIMMNTMVCRHERETRTYFIGGNSSCSNFTLRHLNGAQRFCGDEEHRIISDSCRCRRCRRCCCRVCELAHAKRSFSAAYVRHDAFEIFESAMSNIGRKQKKNTIQMCTYSITYICADAPIRMAEFMYKVFCRWRWRWR